MKALKKNRLISFIIVAIVYILAALAGIIVYRRAEITWWLTLLIADVAATVLTFVFNHTIHIRRTVGRLQKVDANGNLISKAAGVPTTEIVARSPKSANARRTIPLFTQVWDDLMSYRDKQKDMLLAQGVSLTPTIPIFSTSAGLIYEPRTYEDLFKRTLKMADLHDINFHALRHTFATRALEAGMDIKVLSSILGHAQASTTLNFYAHALPDHKRQSMEKMSAFYGKN